MRRRSASSPSLARCRTPSVRPAASRANPRVRRSSPSGEARCGPHRGCPQITRQEVRHERSPLRRLLHDPVAERLQQAPRLCNRSGDRVVDDRRRVEQRHRLHRRRDAQSLRTLLYRLAKRPLRVGDRTRLVRASGGDVQEHRQVPDAAVRKPLTESPCHDSQSRLTGIRPRVGFSPKSPQEAAGMRIDPAPSLAEAAVIIPEATARRCRRSTRPGCAGGSTGSASRPTSPTP